MLAVMPCRFDQMRSAARGKAGALKCSTNFAAPIQSTSLGAIPALLKALSLAKICKPPDKHERTGPFAFVKVSADPFGCKCHRSAAVTTSGQGWTHDQLFPQAQGFAPEVALPWSRFAFAATNTETLSRNPGSRRGQSLRGYSAAR